MYGKPPDVWMPFGSAMNAWGLANKGTKVSADELSVVMDKLYTKAKELIERDSAPKAPVHVYQRPTYPQIN